MSARHPARSVLFFALRFVPIVMICLTFWWMALPYYAHALGFVAAPLLKYVANVPVESYDVSNGNPAAPLQTGTQLSFLVDGQMRTLPDFGNVVTNLATYVALILATTGLAVKRRLQILVFGIALLAAGHVAFILVAFLAGASEITMALAQLFLTLPFLLWIVLAYWQQLARYLFDAAQGPAKETPAQSTVPEKEKEDAE